MSEPAARIPRPAPFIVIEYYDARGSQVGRQVIHGDTGEVAAVLAQREARVPPGAEFYRLVYDFGRVDGLA
jgi:hypothetical protein